MQRSAVSKIFAGLMDNREARVSAQHSATQLTDTKERLTTPAKCEAVPGRRWGAHLQACYEGSEEHEEEDRVLKLPAADKLFQRAHVLVIGCYG